MKVVVAFSVILSLSACNKAAEVRQNTLSDFVVKEENIVKNESIQVTSDEAKKSYKSYLSSSGLKNENRKKALQRLAEIELDIAVSQPVNSKNGYDKNSIRVFRRRIDEFPEDKNNDRVYYQLANAYAITGDDKGKIKALEALTDKYPESKYYIESMFRLGESYLTNNNFIDADLALTAVIVEDKSNKFRKNAFFKRAWSRYKQLQYQAAINDYNQLLSYYPSGHSKNRADQEFLNNIYKVYGVCISYLGINETLSSLQDTLKNKNVRFYVYSNLASLLTKQDRYIEASSVYDMYLEKEKGKYNSQVISSLSDIWLKYENREYAIDRLLELEKRHGVQSNKHNLERSTISKLSNNLILVSEYYHSLYQKGTKDKKVTYLNKALEAYLHLIDGYKYASMDKYHFLYAELLNSSKSYFRAISTYEKIIHLYKSKKYKNKSAYSLLILTNKLFKSNALNRKEYVRLNSGYLKFVSLSKVYTPLLAYSEFLYNDSKYAQSAAVIEEIKVSNKINSSKLSYILASSYFEIKEYALSEKTYHLIKKMKHKYRDIDKRLALSIFKQADVYKEKLLFDQAINKYNEIYKYRLDNATILLSQVELSGLYMRIGKWAPAEKQLNFIRKLYPVNKFKNDITRMLSIVYLNSKKYKLAAVEFEKIHEFGGSVENLRRSALWQSAELYQKGGDLWSSVRTFKKYAKSYKQPVTLNIEAQYKLTEVYAELGLQEKRNYWLRQIVITADNEGARSSDRMKYLASNASIILARNEYNRFSSIKLTIPLKVSLRKKKKVLKSALASLKKVNKYKMYEHVSESIYWIAETYYDFSENLMKSERPKNLSELELEQYDVLLEDQAIPFEDQAIRYFIQNTKLSNKGLYSNWMSKSFDKLSMIYPSKYKRVERVDSQVNQFF